MLNELQCKICGYKASTKQGFNSHLSHRHHIKSKDYYDNYLKQDGEGICHCGNPTKFRNMWYGYNKHCCTRCIPLDPDVQNKMKITCQEKYGTDYAWQAEQTKAKIKQTTRNHYGVDCYLQTDECRKITAEVTSSDKVKDKIKQTNLKHYGVACSFQASVVKDKIKHTKLDRYGRETYNNLDKAKETSRAKYGVDNPTQSIEVQNKMKATCLGRYGVDNIWKDRDSRLKAKKKSQKSMCKHGNRSSLEALLEQYFIDNHIKYEPEYNKDIRYPYFCDFYLPDFDLFIEVNGYYTHCNHWFDSNNSEDVNKLNELIEKSKVHSMYKTCIRVWTQSDVEKRNCAKNNKLNYVVLWSKQDILDWINSGFEIRRDY